MEHEAMTTRRGEIEIFADLERLTQEPGFVYTFCLMTWFALWISPDEVTEIDWHQRPNNEELSLLLGLLVKRSLVLGEMPSEETLQRQADEATELLDELHRRCAFPAPGSHGPSPDVRHEPVPNLLETHREWMLSGQGMVEPIFYGGPGAYIFQYLKMAAKRYSADEAWFQDELGLSFSSILQIAEGVHELSRDRLQKVDLWSSHEQICEDVLAAMSFHSEDIPGIERHTWDKFVSVFSLVPGTVNRNLVSIGACNKVHSHPAVALSDGRHWVPLLLNLAESIYESPFYWMMRDEQYKDTASKNRGDVTEVITRALLVPVFGSGRVHRGVVVTKGKNRRTDLDVLAVSGNKALIVQCKSQQLTLTSRSGDEGMLRRDFHRAVQHAYDQALRGKRALLQRDCKFTDTTGNPVQLPKEIDEVYILCVTGDHYPAVITQTRFFLKKEDGEPEPVIMSVFDLDVVSFYLRDRFDFLYYIRQRSNHENYFIADNENAFLGFHLRHKLFPDDNAPLMKIDQSYSQLVDANFQVTQGSWPHSPSAEKLFHTWKNPSFDQLVNSVKLLAKRQPTRHGAEENLLFFLFDQAGAGADELINVVQRLKRTTRQDGKMHDTRLLMDGNGKGTTIVSFPAPAHPMQEEMMRRDLQGIASAHKYLSQADEWLVLASFADSPYKFDIFRYIKDPWRPDPNLERLVETRLVSGRAVTASGERLGRNRQCPCGSGQKFKRCCGQ